MTTAATIASMGRTGNVVASGIGALGRLAGVIGAIIAPAKKGGFVKPRLMPNMNDDALLVWWINEIEESQ